MAIPSNISNALATVNNTLPFGVGVPGGDGSYKGIPFWITQENHTAGNNVIAHEFPYSDGQFYTESTGKRPPDYVISGYILVDPLSRHFEDLEAALKDQTPGTLILPWRTPDNVFAGQFTITRKPPATNQVTFTANFYRAAALPTPSTMTQKAVDQIAQALTDADAYLDQALAYKNYPSRVKGAITGALNNFRGQIKQLTGGTNPPPFDFNETSEVGSFVKDQTAQNPQGALNFTLPLTSDGTASGNQIAANNQALLTYIHGIALINLTQALPTPPTRQALQSLESQYTHYITSIADRPMQLSYMNLWHGVLASAEAEGLADTRSISISYPVALLALAYAQAGDATFAEDIKAANDLKGSGLLAGVITVPQS